MAELIIDAQHRLEKAAFILKAVAHPLRLAVLELLAINDSMSVGDICERLHCEQSLMSHHLINMKLKGILGSTKEGLSVNYFLKQKDVILLIKCIENCECNM